MCSIFRMAQVPKTLVEKRQSCDRAILWLTHSYNYNRQPEQAGHFFFFIITLRPLFTNHIPPMTTSLHLTLTTAPNPLTIAVFPPSDLHLVKEACLDHTQTGHYCTPEVSPFKNKVAHLAFQKTLVFPCWATSGRCVSSDTNRHTHSRIMGKLLCEDSKCISADPSSQHTCCFRISQIQKPPHCLLLSIDLCMHGSRVDCNCSVHVWLYTISENYHFHRLLIPLPTVAPVLKKGGIKMLFPCKQNRETWGDKTS